MADSEGSPAFEAKGLMLHSLGFEFAAEVLYTRTEAFFECPGLFE